MGLSVISKLANTASTLTPTGTPDAGAGIPGDFAALLSGQTLAALLSQGSSLAGPQTTAQESTTRDTESGAALPSGDAPPALDPAALVALMGNPQIQPAVQPIAQTAAQPASDATTRGLVLAGDIASRHAEGDAGKMAALKTSASETPSLNGTVQGANPADAKSATNTANIAATPEASGNTPAFAANLAALTRHTESATHQQPTVSAPMHSENWPQQFGEKVVWMAKNDLQTAQININPPQLGPVQITLNLSGDQATAVFASPHAEVRQAIESSMPQLRDMLASAGINLSDANVGANLAQQNQNNAFQSPNRAQSALENAILPANDNAPVAGTAMPLKQGRGLVDLFA
jgi:flagellar hook-length control protein FliK